MICLLIGGAPSVGKTETIYRIARLLKDENNFKEIIGEISNSKNQDFRVILEGQNIKKERIRIIINSSSDDVPTIKNSKVFFDKNGEYDFLISSVRDGETWERNQFFSIMGLNSSDINIVEIPLAKITRRKDNFNIAKQWYEEKIDEIIRIILKNKPFEII